MAWIYVKGDCCRGGNEIPSSLFEMRLEDYLRAWTLVDREAKVRLGTPCLPPSFLLSSRLISLVHSWVESRLPKKSRKASAQDSGKQAEKEENKKSQDRESAGCLAASSVSSGRQSM